MAHISGLVAAGEAASPFEHCDVVTTTTHKVRPLNAGKFRMSDPMSAHDCDISAKVARLAATTQFGQGCTSCRYHPIRPRLYVLPLPPISAKVVRVAATTQFGQGCTSCRCHPIRPCTRESRVGGCVWFYNQVHGF
jgi:hypothetical protein